MKNIINIKQERLAISTSPPQRHARNGSNFHQMTSPLPPPPPPPPLPLRHHHHRHHHYRLILSKIEGRHLQCNRPRMAAQMGWRENRQGLPPHIIKFQPCMAAAAHLLLNRAPQTLYVSFFLSSPHAIHKCSPACKRAAMLRTALESMLPPSPEGAPGLAMFKSTAYVPSVYSDARFLFSSNPA